MFDFKDDPMTEMVMQPLRESGLNPHLAQFSRKGSNRSEAVSCLVTIISPSF